MNVLWVVLGFLFVGAVFFVVGYIVADDRAATHDHAERKQFAVQRQVLDIEWKTLQQAQRVNEVFFTARDQMRQAEAEAAGYGSGRRPRPGTGSDPRVVDGQCE